MTEANQNVTGEHICLNSEFSTTRAVTRQRPIIFNKPEEQFESALFISNGDSPTQVGGLRTKGYFKSSLPGKPLITVVTVVFNGKKHFEEALLSVLGQTYDNVEYIIIDGGSTDGTLDIIHEHEHAIDYWVSQKDAGIYDAMNKGIGLATGEFIGLVNADDLIYPKTLKNLSGIIQKNSQIQYTYGKVNFANDEGVVYGSSSPLSKELAVARRFKEMPYPHLSVFVAKDAYKKIGRFNTLFKLGADYDFILRMIHNNLVGERLPGTVGVFRAGGQSGGLKTYIESRRIHCNHGISPLKREMNFIGSILKMSMFRVLPISVVRILKRIPRTSKNSYS
ncbi:Glycosyl transferase, group 2 family protein [Chitinispirillum alkaliphilum]|nr:Glycosyl transferase, group 2 family protein [Chitinispirillum alkaliphilum]